MDSGAAPCWSADPGGPLGRPFSGSCGWLASARAAGHRTLSVAWACPLSASVLRVPHAGFAGSTTHARRRRLESRSSWERCRRWIPAGQPLSLPKFAPLPVGQQRVCFFLPGRPVERLARPGMGTRSCLITEDLSPEVPSIPLGFRPPDSIRRPLHGPGRPQVGLPSSHQPVLPSLPRRLRRSQWPVSGRINTCCLCIQLGANVFGICIRLHPGTERRLPESEASGLTKTKTKDAVSGRGPTRSAQDCRTDTTTASPSTLPGSGTHLFLSIQDETTAFPPNIPCLHLSPLPYQRQHGGVPSPQNPPLHVHYWYVRWHGMCRRRGHAFLESGRPANLYFSPNLSAV